MGRQAKIWKSQEKLTGLGHINDEMKLDEQLRVKIALKVMRKVHIHGSRSERDREKMRRETNIENLTKRINANKSRPKSANAATTANPHEYQLNLYTAVDMFKVKSFEEIEHEAKACSLFKRERKKLENQSSRFGHMRQIFPALIEEIKEEFAAKEQARLDRHRPLTAGAVDGNIPFSPFYSQHNKEQQERAGERGEDAAPSSSLEKTRYRLRPTLRLSIFENGASAHDILVDADHSALDDHRPGQGQVNLTPLNICPSTARSVPALRPAALKRFNSVHFDPAATSSLDHPRADPMCLLAMSSALHKAWPNTPTFNRSIAKEDERILKVKQAKEAQESTRETELKKKIQDREDSYQMRLEARRRQQQQKAWLSLLAFLTRAKVIKQQIEIQRKEKTWMNQTSLQKRATLLIKRWWRQQSFKRQVRAHPMSINILRRCIAVFAVRVRLRRKQRAADLIVEFLRDSDSLSTSMKRIYAFRQSIIKLQRWFRSWLDVQIFRTRLLWLSFEKLAKEKAKADRITRTLNERSSIKAMSKMTGFAETVMEINSTRKKIGKVLHYQEKAARKRRDEITIDLLLYEHHNLPLPHKRMESILVNDYTVVDDHDDNNNNTPLNNSSSAMRLTPLGGSSQHHMGLSRMSTMATNISNPGNSLIRGNAASNGIGSNGNGNGINSSSSIHNQSMGARRGGKIGAANLGGHIMFLGLSQRVGGSDKTLDQWFRRLKASSAASALYHQLRTIVGQQRQRHVRHITTQQSRRKHCPVDMDQLRRYLKDPNDNSLTVLIAKAIGDMKLNVLLASDMRQYPFLLLTKGGAEAVDALLHSSAVKNFRGL